ncbi:hypothetical protein YN1HA_30930 [Sulfurisphaera ohwakuensis]
MFYIRAFYLAALTTIRVNLVIRRFYEEQKLRGKKLIIACAVLYYNKSFNAEE